MSGLYKRKIDVALITLVDNIIDLVDDKPKGKWITKKGRDRKNSYNNVVLDLFLHDEEEFRRFMRMNYEQFIDLTEMIAPIVSKTDKVMKKAVFPNQRLELTLRFLATLESFRSLEYQFWISRKATSYIINEVCKAIVTGLAGTYLKLPSSQEDWQNINQKFEETWNFPLCIGAVDGKHIEIIGCGIWSQYYNYKSANTIALLVIAASNYQVTWADAGMNERILESGVLKRSKLGHMLEEGSLNLPVPEPLAGISVPAPYVFIGDDTFALQPNFMKPFSRKNLYLFTRTCNNCFSRVRPISENVFGIITNRWRVYRSAISLHPEKLRELTMAVLTLHI